MHTLLIKQALIFDGTGNPPSCGDIAVDGDKITAVQNKISDRARRIIDARGLAAAPGFIDMHSHSDRTIFSTPTADSKIRQGVTTEVVCNCGIGSFPVNPRYRRELEAYFGLLEGGDDTRVDWVDCAGFAAAAAKVRPALNIAPLVAHGSLRIAVLGNLDRPPDDREMAQMDKLLAANLDQGAWGMSTGLIYPPGSSATTEELVVLCRTLCRRGAIHASHVRGESSSLLNAIEETIDISRDSGARTLISHLKAIGRPFWGNGIKALGRLQAARANGVDIWADQYPYTATSTGLSALLPDWAQAGGPEQTAARLKAPGANEDLLREVAGQIALRGGPEAILITAAGSPQNRECCGHTLEAIARRRQTTPAEAALQLLAAERGNISAVYFALGENDLEEIMRCPDVLVASDGYAFNACRQGTTMTHPRSYGTFPRVLGHFVREKKLLALETAVRKMTSLPALLLGLPDRGTVKPGYRADLTLFDPDTVADNATFENPHRYPSGIPYVIVNGQLAVDREEPADRRAGRVLLAGRQRGISG